MAGVYRWMTFGLALTGGIALYMASNPQLLGSVMRFWWVFLIAQLGLVVVLSAAVARLSFGTAAVLFLAYAALTGVTFGVLFYAYTAGSIASAFLVSAGAFLALSIFASTTKRDLSGWSTFLFMGLIGVVIASVVQIWLHSPMLNFVTGCAGVVVFAGLTAYDTQKLREMRAQAGAEGVAALSIVGALRLYLDFINLFLSLLRVFGGRRQ
ncbi:MAG TPA: Bax inhibitor-1/YccA family protein [Myxococcaceae bacterium]|nr:Bax inhibitor-1/YccA family protein [Myxococcaceae bacterium]